MLGGGEGGNWWDANGGFRKFREGGIVSTRRKLCSRTRQV